MRTHKTKEEYIAELKGKIARRNEILKAYEEEFKPLLDKFNGKVYNARFINELRKQLQERNKLFNVLNERQSGQNIEFNIILRNDNYNYNDYEALYIGIVAPYTDGNQRIDTSKVHEYAKPWYNNFMDGIEELKGVVKNYDKYMK